MKIVKYVIMFILGFLSCALVYVGTDCQTSLEQSAKRVDQLKLYVSDGCPEDYEELDKELEQWD